jgi:epoxyqueuosine reductase
VPVLAAALEDAEPLVRAHAAWALGRIGTGDALSVLERALETESDDAVRAELTQVMALH